MKYLITSTDKKALLINLYSLPTKCPVCHLFQEPKPLSFQLNDDTDAKVQFSCVNERCNSSFSAFYIKGILSMSSIILFAYCSTYIFQLSIAIDEYKSVGDHKAEIVLNIHYKGREQ